MKLTAFQVHDFRSINDSTKIDLVHRTVLVGRNESGKTSLLKVLAGLKPFGSMPAFTHARDFPRDRPRHEFSKDMVVLDTWWDVDEADRSQLAKLWPRAGSVTGLKIGRRYEPFRFIEFVGLRDVDASAARALGASMAATVRSVESAPPEPLVKALADCMAALEEPIASTSCKAWGAKVIAAAAAVRSHVAQPAYADAAKVLTNLEKAVGAISTDDEQRLAAEKWVYEEMPVFVFLDDWDRVPGHFEITGYLQRKGQGQQTLDDRLFTKLLKVAELDAQELNNLLSQNHEERKLLTNRASRVVTKTLRKLWKDRTLTVDFSVDANHFDVVVSDEESDALVPLDERSRGFRWYFSFFIVFAADTDGGEKANAILLLDEPGLFLHATAQASLIKFLDTLPNQVIYTTHSPFMIDPPRISSVRTVNLATGTGTVVTGEPTGDANTLFPLQAALGYDLTQTLFVGSRTVLVEGVTDYWYLTAASEYLAELGRESLARETVITPAGGAPKVPYMLALLTAQNLKVAVLLDSEPRAEATAKSLVSEKLVRPEGVVHVGTAFASTPHGGADVEDLLKPEVFLELVAESHAKELGGRTPAWNPAIPRIAKRAEDGLGRLGVVFHKTRPARLFLRRMATDAAALMPPPTLEQFERLFRTINAVVDRLVTSDRAPFQ